MRDDRKILPWTNSDDEDEGSINGSSESKSR